MLGQPFVLTRKTASVARVAFFQKAVQENDSKPLGADKIQNLINQ